MSMGISECVNLVVRSKSDRRRSDKVVNKGVWEDYVLVLLKLLKEDTL